MDHVTKDYVKNIETSLILPQPSITKECLLEDILEKIFKIDKYHILHPRYFIILLKKRTICLDLIYL
jgi:hypothetical protein